MKKSLPWIVAVWCLFFGAQAQAASFDCGKAKTKVEKLICSNAELSKLDEELVEAYAEALAKSPEPEKLKAEQTEWLKKRAEKWYDARAASISDIKTKYQLRMGRFRPIRLQNDGGWNVCKAALTRIKSVTPPVDDTLFCGIDLVSGSTEFSEPSWQELPIYENMDLVCAMEIELVGGYPKILPPLENWRKGYEEKVRSGEIKPRLRFAKVLLSSDGPEETVLAYSRNRNNMEQCRQLVANGGDIWLYKVDGVGDHIFLLDPASRKVREFNFADYPVSGSKHLKQTVIHDSRLYLFSVYPFGLDYIVTFFRILRSYHPEFTLDNSHVPDIEILSYYGRNLGDIAISKPQKHTK